MNNKLILLTIAFIFDTALGDDEPLRMIVSMSDGSRLFGNSAGIINAVQYPLIGHAK